MDMSASVGSQEKLDGYFGHVRQELVSLVDAAAQQILELGCGYGATGEALKLRQGASVIGLELNPEAAAVAETCLDEVVVADLDSYRFPWAADSFDAVVAGDIIEHLKDPWRVLHEVRRLLKPNGQVVISIPNIANHDIIEQLANGVFNYTDAGLLDRTHLHFFTRKTFASTLMDAGLQVSGIYAIYDGAYARLTEEVKCRGGFVSLQNVTVFCPTPEAIADLMCYQWVFTANPLKAS